MYRSDVIELLKKAWLEDLTIRAEYTNACGDTSEYVIWDVRPDSKYGNGTICHQGYINAFCGTKDDEEYDKTYTFKIDRFEWAEIVDCRKCPAF